MRSTIFTLLLPVSFFILGKINAQSENRKIISSAISTTDSVYKLVEKNYISPVDFSKMMHSGLDASLRLLDPHSNYFSNEEAEQFRTFVTGKFGGVGFVIDKNKDSAAVITQVFQGFPADRAGLRSADHILEIDGISTTGKDFPDVISQLRGTPGTVVKMLISRPGEKQTFIKTISREVIVMSSVFYYGVLDGDIGYISLTAETEDCSEDVKKAFVEITRDHRLKGLILDLRNNVGGLISEARKIVNLFVEKNTPVYSLRYNFADSVRYTLNDAIDPAVPLVVLANAGTASSGEVLTGALQDLDRAVIIGQKTYGKGIVQQLYDLPDGAMLKLTIAEYLTPSGRCIQNKTYSVDAGAPILIPDSLKKTFKTKNGRTVKDHDGITPDIMTDEKATAMITKGLADKNYFFEFATRYRVNHPSVSSVDQFHLSDAEYTNFTAFVRSRSLDYATNTEGKISDIKKTAKEEGYWSNISRNIESMEAQLKKEKDRDLMRYKGEIKDQLEQEILSRYYYNAGRIRAGLRNDADVIKAIGILKNQAEYKRILSIK